MNRNKNIKNLLLNIIEYNEMSNLFIYLFKTHLQHLRQNIGPEKKLLGWQWMPNKVDTYRSMGTGNSSIPHRKTISWTNIR